MNISPLSSLKLNSEDLLLIEDSDFLLAKVEVMKKINGLMEDTRSSLQTTLGSTDFVFPTELNLSAGKVSKGEYYRHLPYFVLDYPALFGKPDTIAFRTMFWWGNFFSATLHLQGIHLEENKERILENLELLLNNDVYICVGETPWEYHYGPDNYEILEARHAELISSGSFLKLSRKTEISNWEAVPEFSRNTLELFLSAL